MNLLIFGFGGHGKVCGELASEIFEEISYLDDNAPCVIGSLAEYKAYTDMYDYAFVAFGDPELRERWTRELRSNGVRITAIISEKAIVSKTAIIGEGTVVMGGAIIQTGAIVGQGCIVSAGAVVDHNAVIGDYCHINCNAVVPAGKRVPEKTKINYGEIYVEVS